MANFVEDVAGTTVGEASLPPPPKAQAMSLDETLAKRRSVREFDPQPLTLAQVSGLLWAAQGATGPERRTAPSAGATYPLEVYVVTGGVDGLADGVYRYIPGVHRIEPVAEGDIRSHLAAAALEQEWMSRAAMIVVIAAVFERTTAHYGKRGERYVHMEAGHAAQNLLLQAVALGLGATPVGAFSDTRVSRLLRFPEGLEPLYLVPVGRISAQ